MFLLKLFLSCYTASLYADMIFHIRSFVQPKLIKCLLDDYFNKTKHPKIPPLIELHSVSGRIKATHIHILYFMDGYN